MRLSPADGARPGSLVRRRCCTASQSQFLPPVCPSSPVRMHKRSVRVRTDTVLYEYVFDQVPLWIPCPDSCPLGGATVCLALTAHCYLAAAIMEALRCCSRKKDLSSARMTPADSYPTSPARCGNFWLLRVPSSCGKSWSDCPVLRYSAARHSQPRYNKYVLLCARTFVWLRCTRLT